MTVVYPMRFNDSIDIILATSFLQVEFFQLMPHLIGVALLKDNRGERDRGKLKLNLEKLSYVVFCSFVGWFNV